MTDDLVDQIAARLEQLPAALEPLDLTSLDGFLCGVLVQPVPIEERRWWPFVLDAEGRLPAPAVDTSALRALVAQRHHVLQQAIDARQWFDPWVFEAEDSDSDLDRDDTDADADADADPTTAAALPWVIGFVTALEVFPALMRFSAAKLDEPLALLYRFLSPDDLEDADGVLEAIDELPPLESLDDAVEGLVRATLLLADVAAGR